MKVNLYLNSFRATTDTVDTQNLRKQSIIILSMYKDRMLL